MQFDGAVIKEQGVTFAIVIVKKHIVDNISESEQAMSSFSSIFPNMPVILMAQGSGGRPYYRGRKDIVNFLSNVPINAIPWRKYHI